MQENNPRKFGLLGALIFNLLRSSLQRFGPVHVQDEPNRSRIPSYSGKEILLKNAEETATANFVRSLYVASIFAATSLLVLLSALLLAVGASLLVVMNVRGLGLLFVFVYFLLGVIGLVYVRGLVRNREILSYVRTSTRIRNYFRTRRIEGYATSSLLLFALFLTLTGLYTPIDGLLVLPKVNYNPLFLTIYFLPVFIGGTLLNPVNVFVRVTMGLPGLSIFINLVPIFFESVYLAFIAKTVVGTLRRK